MIFYSVLGAASYGFAAVLQHKAASSEAPELTMKLGLLWSLLKKPIWLMANVLDALGFVFQFLALRRGELAIVEPILVMSLVFALAGASIIRRGKPPLSDTVSAVVVTLGVGVFLDAARPTQVIHRVHPLGWATLTILTALLTIVGVILSRGGSPKRAAICLAAASGFDLGYMASMAALTGKIVNHGVIHTLSTGAPYALALSGFLSILLVQSAFQAGPLRFSLPLISVMQPVIGMTIGELLLGQRVNFHGIAPLLEVVGLAVMTAGVIFLARGTVGETMGSS
ncbi:MAG: DMT family transporter [Acidimicrobiales bacterium]|nr:DMT family transporter [Acidimicrobiales bacterium]